MPSPTYPGVYVEEVPGAGRTIRGVSTSVTAFLGHTPRGPVDEPVRILDFAEFARLFGGLAPDSALSYAASQFFENGGREAWVVRVARRASGAGAGPEGPPDATTLVGSPAGRTGLYALDRVGSFDVLCIPGESDAGVLAAAVRYCEDRRVFLVADLPAAASTVADAQAWVTTGPGSVLRSGNVAVHFPRLRQPDPLLGMAPRDFPSSGAVAGLYARTDAERGIWKAPAGIEATIRGVLGPAIALSDSEIAELRSHGINPLRTVPGGGTVSWSARTLGGEHGYVQVRRLALHVEESLRRGMQWAVFEPNGERLWAELRLAVGAFLHGLFVRGAFAGATPQDAYFVKCDRETTTATDVTVGRVSILVGFAPLRPAEFVVVRIEQLTGALRP